MIKHTNSVWLISYTFLSWSYKSETWTNMANFSIRFSLSLFSLSTTITAQITCLLGIFPYWKFILKSIFVSSCGKGCEWQKKRILFVWTVEDMNWVNVDRVRENVQRQKERWRNKNLQEPVCVSPLDVQTLFFISYENISH